MKKKCARQGCSVVFDSKYPRVYHNDKCSELAKKEQTRKYNKDNYDELFEKRISEMSNEKKLRIIKMRIIKNVPKLSPRPVDGHKGDFGKVCIIAGSFGMS